MKKLPPRAENLRRALAQEAARIMSEHGIRDFLTAKRKAAERFGVTDGSVLPKNTEIEDALAEYQRLFGGTKHGETLAAQRNAALSAMQMLADFEPRLVGSVLAGTATEHNDIQLHLFAERAGVHHLPAHGSRHRSRSGGAARALRRRSRGRLSRRALRIRRSRGGCDGVSGRRNPPGAGQPGRRQTDAAHRRRRTRSVAGRRGRAAAQ